MEGRHDKTLLWCRLWQTAASHPLSQRPIRQPKGPRQRHEELRHPLHEGDEPTRDINENGKRKTISKLAAAVTQLANDAARGDKKSIQVAFALWQALEPTIETQRPQEVIVISGPLAGN
jgi:hypothetical protein